MGRCIPLRRLPAVLAVASLAAQQQSAPPLTKTDRQRGQAMLKQLKEDIEKHYYDPKFRGIDLAAKFSAAQQLLENATTLNDMYAVISDAAMQFDDSHTYFIPPGPHVSVSRRRAARAR